MKEGWKEIEGFEGVYSISNLGRVRSFPRKVKFGSQKRMTEDRVLKSSDNGRGYKYVTLSYKGVAVREYVHRLVAKHFLEKGKDRAQVNHKNGDKSDNTYNNLEWVTQEENEEHAVVNGLIGGTESQLTLLKMNMIIDLLKSENYTIAEIEGVFGVSKTVIDQVRKTDKQLREQFALNKSKRNSRGKKIEIISKENKESKVFDSAKAAARHHGYYDGYFSELIGKYNGSNEKYEARYL